jgi:hypothetical protein
MTKEEAIKELECYLDYTFGAIKEALAVAIDAIETVMRLENETEKAER